MPDVNQGLTVGDEAPPEVDLSDPNSQEGFEAALARSIGGDTEEDVAPAVADGLEQPGTEPARDEHGRFVKQTPPETVEEEAQAEPLLAGKYKTVEDLEKAYAEAQSLIGRKDQEMNDRLARLEAEVKASQEAEPAGPMTEEDVNGISEMLSEHGGQRTFAWIAENREDLIDETLKQWIIDDPAEAIPVATRYHTIRAQQELGAQPSALPPSLQRTVELDELRNVMGKVAAGTSDWESVSPHLEKALEGHDNREALAVMMKSGNPVSQEAALKFLLPSARILAMQAAASGSPAVTADQAAKVAAAKKATALVTGSQSAASALETGTEADESAARIAAFKASFAETPTSDIGAGLTFGKD